VVARPAAGRLGERFRRRFLLVARPQSPHCQRSVADRPAMCVMALNYMGIAGFLAYLPLLRHQSS
jgi:hypothetical protein